MKQSVVLSGISPQIPNMKTMELSILVTIGELFPKFDEFLAERSQFDSDHGVNFYAPTCCQSATFVRPLFAFYCPLFFTKQK